MRRNWKSLGAGSLMILALTITATLGTASADPVAQASGLKKCLKKAKKIKDPVKRKKAKKKCRKKFAPAPKPQPAPQPAPLVRATLTWSGGGGSTDYDLYVFDPNGVTARAVSNPIPNTTFSGNATGPSGTETFTDLIYTNPGGRNFQFGVCHEDGGSDGSSYSIDYVTADGVHHLDTRSGGSDGFNARYSGGAPALNTFTCPAL